MRKKKQGQPKQKEEEYPKIAWTELSNPDVQQATILYNDRINTWRRMKQLDEQLEISPTEQAVKEMAELRIRNLQAFDELQSLNDTGKFLFKHPLLSGKSEFAQLLKLFRSNPSEFLHRHKLVLDNIRRYRSFLERKDRKARRADDRKKLAEYQEKDRMFLMVIKETTGNSQ